MDDSAAVADRLVDEWLPTAVVRRLAADLGDDPEAARTAVVFLAGAHDIGKATPAFAVQDPLLAARMRSCGLAMPDTPAGLPDRRLAHHSVAGHHLLARWLVDQGWSRRPARTWAVVIGGHHGVPPDSLSERAARPEEVPENYGEGLWASVRSELLNRIAMRTGALDQFERWKSTSLSPQFQVVTTGLVIIADWIASNADLFPFATDAAAAPEEAKRVQEAMRVLSLPSPWSATSSDSSPEEVFRRRFSLPPGALIRPVQQAAVEVAREVSTPGLVVIEAPMGEGKTEAALAAAEELAARSGAGGLFVALPTQATTDAMFTRVMNWLDRLGDDDTSFRTAVTLGHGKARFNQLLQGLPAIGRLHDIGRDEAQGETRHTVAAHAWLTGRKKAHLANFVVATIDQLLFAGLRARHLMLRHLSLAGKVVIIDEVHAYDAFMNSYLTKVLTWLGAYRVPVIALSATLPEDRRRELVSAYQRGVGRKAGMPQANENDDGDPGYPLLTWTDDAATHRRVIPPSGRHTTVRLHLLSDDDEALLRVLREALVAGGTAVVIRNTVRRVIATAELIERDFPGEVTVAHSRFVVADRVANDEALVAAFGPPGGSARRPHRHIVVASQVVEQSLDVDFDLLVTDLAPVDLVLQRLGRLHRHQRGTGQRERPARLREARAYLTGVSLDPEGGAPEPDSASARYVYGAYPLLRSMGVLLPHIGGTLHLPDDIAPLVHRAYGDEPVGPPSWQPALQDAGALWQEANRRRRDRAASFQIAEPAAPGSPIVGWLTGGVGEVDDSAEGQGQVRDGAPSLEVIVVQAGPSGEWRVLPWLPAGGGLPVSTDTVPPPQVARHLAASALRLPLEFSTEAAEEQLWLGTPPAWENSPLIYRMPVLVVDADGWAELAGRRIRYTRSRGLEVMSTHA